jgi:A/G-specific adenine glycosylase
LRWYRPRRTAYPWRRTRDPYAILVSEVMLQQTQAARVASSFGRFIDRFPTVASLASADRSDVIRQWSGLGYNRRAVSLWRTARLLVDEGDGAVPGEIAALRRLPGVGAYTASAVAAIAFGAPVAAIDTNVRRVVGRVLAGGNAVSKSELERLSTRWLGRCQARDWNEAVMDLGRSICRPRPRCGECPLRRHCRFMRSGAVAARPARSGSAFEGSSRQVRGDIVAALRHVPSGSLASLAARTAHPLDRVERAVIALVADGLLEAGGAALRGSPRGRVRLAR